MLTLLLACTQPPDSGDTHDTSVADDTGTPTAQVYAFTNADGDSSVSYSGQVLRHLLIDDMKAYIGGLTARIDAGEIYPAAGDIESDLAFYLDHSDAFGEVPHGRTTDPAPAQATYGQVASGKNLWGKLAGNDATGQHADWTTDFVGWETESPQALVEHWVAQIDQLAADRVQGDVPLDPSGAPIPAVYVTPQGQDLNQLLDKFLRVGIAYSQATDDYMDDDLDGKGLLSEHAAYDDGAAYTALEHGWDEGFGYFGASVWYGQQSDDEIAGTGCVDHDGDGAIDLLSECNVGHSVNCAKRDAGAVAATDLTLDAWTAFLSGRQLLADTAGQGLSAAQLTELQGHRDQAVLAWEQALAATVVHYINRTLADMSTFDTADYSFTDHAKHWSEAKGFALGLQFNPRSQMSDAQFAELHELLGQAPVLPSADAQAQVDYAIGLRTARTLLQTAYGFDAANMGDDHGAGGW